MKKKQLIFFGAAIGALLASCCAYTYLPSWTGKPGIASPCQRTSKPAEIKRPKGAYFVPVPLSKFTERGLPCLSVEIGETPFCMELDLGFAGDAGLQGGCLDQIEPKTALGMGSIYGFLGKKYSIRQYQVPKIRIGAMSFLLPTLEEVNEQWRQDAIISQDACRVHEPGRIGWELFYNVNLLLDLAHEKIAFCDSMATLCSQGYCREDFVQTPLMIERGLLEIQAMTDVGALHCVLDTGATWNILNSATTPDRSIEQEMENPLNQWISQQLQIGGVDFGPETFRRISIQLPIYVSAILGMEFFNTHVVFIDFQERSVYCKTVKNTP